MIKNLTCSEIPEGENKGLLKVEIICDLETSEYILTSFTRLMQFSKPYGGLEKVVNAFAGTYQELKGNGKGKHPG